MSEDTRVKVCLELAGLSDDERLALAGDAWESMFDSIDSAIEDRTYSRSIDEGRYTVLNGTLYRITEFSEFETPHFAEVQKYPNGDVTAHVGYYNGSGHWSEYIEQELDKSPATSNKG